MTCQLWLNWGNYTILNLVYLPTLHLQRSSPGTMELLKSRELFFFRSSIWYVTLIVYGLLLHKQLCIVNISLVSFRSFILFPKKNSSSDLQYFGCKDLFLRWAPWCLDSLGANLWSPSSGRDEKDSRSAVGEQNIFLSGTPRCKLVTLIHGFRTFAAVNWSITRSGDSHISAVLVLVTATWVAVLPTAQLITLVLWSFLPAAEK